MNYSYIQNDGGRSQSKRPKQKSDCTVRALAIACNIPYDAAYDILAYCGRKCSQGFSLAGYLKQFSWAKKIPFQAVKGQKRMNPVSFCNQYKEGVYICKVAKHVFAVIDGIVHDDFVNRDDRCIYTAWKIEYKK